jgi:hypothetical protein
MQVRVAGSYLVRPSTIRAAEERRLEAGRERKGLRGTEVVYTKSTKMYLKK